MNRIPLVPVGNSTRNALTRAKSKIVFFGCMLALAIFGAGESSISHAAPLAQSVKPYFKISPPDPPVCAGTQVQVPVQVLSELTSKAGGPVRGPTPVPETGVRVEGTSTNPKIGTLTPR